MSGENGAAGRNGHRGEAYTLITGGAGFIGTNLAHRLLAQGKRVLVFDNLSRPGVKRNLEWLRETHGSLVQAQLGDVRDAEALDKAVQGAERVVHLAAQVAVTTSLDDPIHDFRVNAEGTLNLLEALRRLDAPPPLLFTSTNKVYGAMEDVAIRRAGDRYEPVDAGVREHGFCERRSLAFHSPYGCSKGCADQYVLDYAHTFGLPAVVFRMSCIYGPHQFGTEDQGWVAHFLIRALEGGSITIYGDGRQVRDVLFVDDLIDAFLLAHANIERLSGQAFNIGGGPSNTISLLSLLDLIAEELEARPRVLFDDWRAADQRYYVSSIRKFGDATGWKPHVRVEDGVRELLAWLRESRAETRARREAVAVVD